MARVSIDDIKIDYRSFGQGAPVVLIHGLACGKRMWFHQVRALAGRYRVITYDQRGHGLSDAPDDPARYSAGYLPPDAGTTTPSCRQYSLAGLNSEGD